MTATFLERPNRFIGVFSLPGVDGPCRGHIADPGRLKELLVPGATVFVRDHGSNTHRKLRYSIPFVLSQESGVMVSIESTLPNKLMDHFIASQRLPFFKNYHIVKKEITVGKHRLDFLLRHQEKDNILLEVKGASLVVDGVCLFPDAPTIRGASQVRTLAEAAISGRESHLVIVVQREDARLFKPHVVRDPDFAAACQTASEAGVTIRAITVQLSTDGGQFINEIPVELK